LRQAAQNSENEALRFAKRSERLRDEDRNSLRSLRVLNQVFRGIVYFQWIDPNFVSHVFACALLANVAAETLSRSGDHGAVF
jgi:hypothetical protein